MGIEAEKREGGGGGGGGVCVCGGGGEVLIICIQEVSTHYDHVVIDWVLSSSFLYSELK